VSVCRHVNKESQKFVEIKSSLHSTTDVYRPFDGNRIFQRYCIHCQCLWRFRWAPMILTSQDIINNHQKLLHLHLMDEIEFHLRTQTQTSLKHRCYMFSSGNLSHSTSHIFLSVASVSCYVYKKSSSVYMEWNEKLFQCRFWYFLYIFICCNFSMNTNNSIQKKEFGKFSDEN
jgi:hypothetical protein